MITIYTIAYNEEIILPFFIKWYRERFPNCRIIIYDNYSTDNTEKIALENNCTIIKYDSNNQIRDDLYLEIKNNCWKSADTDWVIVCDADELLDIDENYLLSTEYDIIQGKGYEMCGKDENIEKINKGIYAHGYSKCICFNKTKVIEINYTPGCHTIDPVPKNLKTGKEIKNLYHFKWLNYEYVKNRYNLFSQRLSKINKEQKWGYQYNLSDEELLKFNNNLLNNRTEIL